MGTKPAGVSRRLGALALLILTGCQALPSSRLPLPAGRSRVSSAENAPVPGNFLWGVSVAGHQVDGGDTTSNWARWADQGKTDEKPGRAVDFWHRFDGDFDLTRSMGANAVRMSIEWARLEPRRGTWDEGAAAHYREMFAAMRRKGLTPIVTLSHWSMPMWVDDQGGWTNRDTVAQFGRFVEKAAREVAPEAKYWITFNEPNLWIPRDYLLGWGPPGKRNPIGMAKAARNVIRGHALAYDILHAANPAAMVSANTYEIMFGKPQAPVSASDTSFIDTDWFHDALDTGRLPGDDSLEPENDDQPLLGKMDYIAFDYYWQFGSIKQVINVAKPWTLGIAPDRMEQVLLKYHRKYNLPIMIAENGIATEEGKPRADGWTRDTAMVATIRAMKRAMGQGANVIGYCHWSLMDNYEWGTYTPRFGLFTVDARNDPSLRRIPTTAVETYKRIILGDPGATPPTAGAPQPAPQPVTIQPSSVRRL